MENSYFVYYFFLTKTSATDNGVNLVGLRYLWIIIRKRPQLMYHVYCDVYLYIEIYILGIVMGQKSIFGIKYH